MELNSIRTNKHISLASSEARVTMGDIMNTRCQSGMMDVAWEQNTGSHKLCPIGHWSQWTALTSGPGSGQILAELGLMGTLARHPDIQEAGNFFSDCLASLHSPCKWATLFLTLKCWRASIPSLWHPLLSHLGSCLWGQRINLGCTYILFHHEPD